MLNPSILNNYLESFFGYGRWSAPVWFIGIEEAGGKAKLEIEQRLANDPWTRSGILSTTRIVPWNLRIGKIA